MISAIQSRNRETVEQARLLVWSTRCPPPRRGRTAALPAERQFFRFPDDRSGHGRSTA
nr:hypothetical protein [Burkholderia sp. TSV86]